MLVNYNLLLLLWRRYKFFYCKVQLELFNTYLSSMEFNNDGSFEILQISDCFYNLLPASMSEVATILELLMVMPATSTVNERTALSQRQVKTYLRSTCSQKCLNI